MKKTGMIIVVGFIAIVLHNFIFMLFNVEEAFFFILVIFVFPLHFLMIILYSAVYNLKKKM